MIPQSLKYAEEGKDRVKHLEIRPPRRALSKDEHQHDEMKSIRNFLAHTRWHHVSEHEDKSGITWLELFLWYRMHSPRPMRKKGGELLEPKPTLQKEIDQV